MNMKKLLIDFVVTFAVTLVVTVIVSFLYIKFKKISAFSKIFRGGSSSNQIDLHFLIIFASLKSLMRL